MGKRGPAPTPTRLLEARGSWLAKTRVGEPVAPDGEPRRPAWVAGKALQVWKQVVPMLSEMGTLARTDGGAIGRYCVLFVQWIAAQDELRKRGLTYEVETKRGSMIAARPEVGIECKLSVLLLRLEQEFGLTPSARARISVEPKAKQDSKSDFLISGLN